MPDRETAAARRAFQARRTPGTAPPPGTSIWHTTLSPHGPAPHASTRTSRPSATPARAAPAAILLGLALSAAYVAGPFLTMFFAVLGGHTSGGVQGWWKDVLSLVCFGWLISCFFVVPGILALCVTRRPGPSRSIR